jgi:hypothetical protein
MTNDKVQSSNISSNFKVQMSSILILRHLPFYSLARGLAIFAESLAKAQKQGKKDKKIRQKVTICHFRHCL